ncbi:polyadenylate-binding protein 1-A-like isoform X1 [Tachysurus fulvidraco]|uniref:polyadenylate-binding protein 1-A-like isoform X1 n=1 Tax=Tachysurus fulvidraco TaxID=1234273 RepID=UPI001FF06C10|nr:polyadenylate-binding protein 1-A-like isoform X1 [Tachysurus fulvidraco]
MNSDSMMPTLYVGDLHPKVTEPMIKEKFGAAGFIHSIRLCKDKKTGSSLGYAFVNFKHRADAERALEMYNFKPLMERPMRVVWYQRDPALRNSCIGKLIIKNLDKSMDNLTLFETFSVFGKVLSCKVVANNKGSKGFGFVQFESEEAASRAMMELNSKYLKNHKVFIERFKPLEERKAEKMNRKQVHVGQKQTKEERQTHHNQRTEQGVGLIIKNLDWQVDDKHLRTEFAQFGTVVSAKVKKENGHSQGFGFVHFVSSVDAMRAKQEMDGRIWGRKVVHVEMVQHKEERTAYLPSQTKGTIKSSTRHVPRAVHTVPVVDTVPVVVPAADEASSTPVASMSEVQQEEDTTDVPTYPPTGKHLTSYMQESSPVDDQIQIALEMNSDSMMPTLYVGDLHPKVTEPMIKEKFSAAGFIHSIRLCKDKKTGSSLGYAFVNFKHRADAERALEMYNFKPLMGRPMRVVWYQRDPTLRNSCIGKLIIKNLDKSMDNLTLFETFSVFGKVLSCKVVANNKGSKGFGFVQFESEEAASRAMMELNSKYLKNRKVFIERFKPRKERKAEDMNSKQVHVGPEQTKEERQTHHNQRTEQGVGLIIKNLDRQVDDKHLRTEFAQFGTIISAKVKKENGHSQGFGFVHFVSSVDAMRAKQEMDGRIWGRKVVHVEMVQHKEEHTAYLPSQTKGTIKSSTRHVPRAVHTVPVVDTVPVVVPAADEASSTPVDSMSEVQQEEDTTDVPTYPPAGKRQPIHILKSSPVDDQIQMAHDYMLPLVEKIHPTQTGKIQCMNLEGENNYNIINMIGEPELLDEMMDKMDALGSWTQAGNNEDVL